MNATGTFRTCTIEVDWLTCSCCGKGIKDTPDSNVAHGRIPYPYDTGYGMCTECGGDKNADDSSDEGFKRKMGWATITICEARFDVVRKNLSPKHQAHWDSCNYRKKCAIVLRLMEKGIII